MATFINMTEPQLPPCVGDTNADLRVGLPDLLQVLSGYQQGSDMERLMDSFGSTLGDARYLSEFDSDGDGSIGLPDLLAFLSDE